MSGLQVQTNCELGQLVRRLELPDTDNVVPLGRDAMVTALTPEEALIQWVLDLPDGTSVSRAAEYALRIIDRGDANPPSVDRLCAYLRQARVAGSAPRIRSRRHRRRNG